MTEQGAAADNACRDGAPGGAGLLARARAPRDPHPPQDLGPGILARNTGLASRWREPRKLPGAVASRVYPTCAPNMPISA